MNSQCEPGVSSNPTTRPFSGPHATESPGSHPHKAPTVSRMYHVYMVNTLYNIHACRAYGDGRASETVTVPLPFLLSAGRVHFAVPD